MKSILAGLAINFRLVRDFYDNGGWSLGVKRGLVQQYATSDQDPIFFLLQWGPNRIRSLSKARWPLSSSPFDVTLQNSFSSPPEASIGVHYHLGAVHPYLLKL